MQIRTTARRLATLTRPVMLAGAVEMAVMGSAQTREQDDGETPEPSTYTTSCSGYMVAVG
ncbi:MAG TPA: hypothetical protein VEA99_15840 [Gemmatimonadaceae bacterium]|nr:hypothetical protein [Gemmatimonadaceae bacterium]